MNYRGKGQIGQGKNLEKRTSQRRIFLANNAANKRFFVPLHRKVAILYQKRATFEDIIQKPSVLLVDFAAFE